MKHGSFVQSLAIAIGNAIGIALSSVFVVLAPLARIFAPIAVLFFSSAHAQAAQEIPTAFALEGVLYDSPVGTTTLLDPAASVRVQILNPAGTCILYDETQSVDTSSSDGVFSIEVGSATGAGKRTGGSDPGNTMVTVFQNSAAIPAVAAPSQTCAGNSYTPAAGAARLLRIIVTPSSTGTPDTLAPDMYLGSVPTALVAERAENLQGRTPASFLELGTTTELTQANFENIFSNTNYPNLDALVDGTSTQYIQRDTSNGAEIPSYGAAPASPSAGNIWFNTSNNTLEYYDGTGVVTVGSGGGTGDFLADGSIPMTGTLKMGGNTIYGNSIATGTLTLDSTSNASKGNIVLNASGGNVGIGTSSPQRQLHIATSTPSTPTMLALQNSSSVNGSGATLSFRTDTTGTGATTFKELVSLIASFDEHDDATATSSLRFHTTVAGTLAERMRISSGGYVGIGTTAPGSALVVKGTLRLSGATSGYVGFAPAAAAGSTTYTLPSADGTNGQVLTTDGSGALSWATASGGGAAARA